MDPQIVTRFAPSPTGALHLGNARTALFSASCWRGACGGRFILRVEDTDSGARQRRIHRGPARRSRLAGPRLGRRSRIATTGADPTASRSAVRPLRRTLTRSSSATGHSYPCYCTPAELDVARRHAARGGPAAALSRHLPQSSTPRRAPRACGRKAGGRWRFRVPESRTVEFDDLVRGPQSVAAATLGDFVVRRADGGPMFFFCNAVDDALMGVTQVLRGDDHLSNTPRQLLLLRCARAAGAALRPPAARCSMRAARRCPSAAAAPRSPNCAPAATSPLRSATTCCGSATRRAG